MVPTFSKVVSRVAIFIARDLRGYLSVVKMATREEKKTFVSMKAVCGNMEPFA